MVGSRNMGKSYRGLLGTVLQYEPRALTTLGL